MNGSSTRLQSRIARLVIDNAQKRNALSLSVLRSLRSQLHEFNTGPDGKLYLLPPFKPEILQQLEEYSIRRFHTDLAWMIDTEAWQQARGRLPKVVILKTEGPVFCSGHDLKELRSLSYEEVKEAFSLCAEVMSLIRRSPAPVISVVQGMATAAGAQLALAADLPMALKSTKFQLPGANIGLPCTSPSTVVSRRLGSALTYRMLALAEPIEAKSLSPGVIELAETESELDVRLDTVVNKLASDPGQPQAFGKWAFWTQVAISSSDRDEWTEAFHWAGRVMALHARTLDAKEGIDAFFQKRRPHWIS